MGNLLIDGPVTTVGSLSNNVDVYPSNLSKCALKLCLGVMGPLHLLFRRNHSLRLSSS